MELQPKSAPEEEAFLRVWQRVTAPASPPLAAPPPPETARGWDEAGFLAAAMDDLRCRRALCTGGLCVLCPALAGMQRRLAAAYYLLTGQRRRPVRGEEAQPVTALERCREQYRRALTAAAAFDRAAEQGQEREGLYRAIAEENRAAARQVEELTGRLL